MGKFIKLDKEISLDLPMFHNYVESFDKQKTQIRKFDLLMSNKIGSYAIIMPPSKVISCIIDYSKI